MKKLFRVLYRYKGETQLREHYQFAKNVEEAKQETRNIFPKIKIKDAYQFN